MIIRGITDKEKLQHIYKTIHKYIKDDKCYYSQEEIENLKKDRKNIFYKGGVNND